MIVGSFIYHNGLEIREDRIHDLERLAELGLVQEDDLIERAIFHTQIFHPTCMIEHFLGHIVFAKSPAEMRKNKMQVLETLGYSAVEFKQVDQIIYSRYRVHDVRPFPNLQAVFSKIHKFDDRQVWEIRKQLHMDILQDETFHHAAITAQIPTPNRYINHGVQYIDEFEFKINSNF
jgi:hypothetical protein